MFAFIKRLLGGGGGRPPAPVVKTKPANDIDYRFASDPPHVIRIEQARPKGFPRKVAENVPVAGVSFRAADVDAFIAGSQRVAELRVGEWNGAPAVEVWGKFQSKDGSAVVAQLGHLPQDVALALRGHDSLGATVERMFVGGNGQNAGLRLDVWGAREPKPKK